MKVALVLEGGAMRGLYTAGVLDEWLTHDLPVHGMLTVSAGALFGVNYPSRQIGRSLRYNLRYVGDPRYMSWRSWFKTKNLVNKDFAYYQLPSQLDPFDQATFAASGIDFYVTVTNLETGQAEYHLIEDAFQQMELLRASSAMPLMSEVIDYEGQRYLDGGVADSIPVKQALSMGYDKVIVVLTRTLDYRKSDREARLFRPFFKKYPHFRQQLLSRATRYNQTVEEILDLQARGEIFVVRPSRSLGIKRIEKDKTKLQAMYDLGRQDAKLAMAGLMEYLRCPASTK